MNKHTPGPWFIDESYHTSINNAPVDQKHKHIAMVNFYNCADPNQRVNEEEHQANVKLIAAAPEMLEALEKIVKTCDYCDDGFIEYQPSGINGYLPTGDANFVTEPCFYCGTAREAIAKATGK